MRINHNIASMVTQGALYSVNQAESKSLQKLSTGLRINSASDDAAGLGVSENLRTQVTGLQQAQKNTQDAISLLNIADGALNEQSSILQRMRELTVQAKNDTYTSTERGYMGSEFDALFHELDRIAAVTNYNNMQIFAAPETSYIGTPNAGLDVYQNDNLNASPHQLTDERTIFTNQNDAFGGGNDYASSNHFNFMVGANYTAQDAAQYNNASAAWNPGAGDMITVQFTQMDTNTLFSPAPDLVEASSLLETPSANGGVNPFGWDITQNPDQAIAGAITDHTATIQDKLGMILDLIDGDPLDPQLETAFFQGGAGNGTNLTGLKRINTMRAEIGAMTNRLQDSVNNDQTGASNQQAAESQIRDVDFASETTNFTKEQILSQSATAMLAQANSVPQSVLQLLK
jgi:flagellin